MSEYNVKDDDVVTSVKEIGEHAETREELLAILDERLVDFAVKALNLIQAEHKEEYVLVTDNGELNDLGQAILSLVVRTVSGSILRKFQTPEAIKKHILIEEEGLQYTLSKWVESQMVAMCKESMIKEMATDSMMRGFINTTGNAGKALLNAELAKLYAEARESEKPLSVIYLDVDHFKQVNDRYGHGVGDMALSHVAKVIKATVRDALFIRRGGEEIVVVLKNSGAADAAQVAVRVKAAMNKRPLLVMGTWGSDNGKSILKEIREVPPDSGAYENMLSRRIGDDLIMRGVETTFSDPRRNDGRTATVVRLPLSASIGVSGIDIGAEDPYGKAIELANQQESLSKENGRNCVFLDGNKIHARESAYPAAQ